MKAVSVHLNNITKRFFSGKTLRAPIWCHLEMVIQPGEKVLLLGDNGVGKTTLLKLMCGLCLPDSGEVLIDSQNLSKTSRQDIGTMLAFEMLYMNLTGRQNLSYSAGASHPKVKREAINEMAVYWKLSDKLDEKVETYSYGMKTRLALARALINKPSLILLDEPTITLDEDGCILLREYLAQTTATVVIATHQADIFSDGSFRKLKLSEFHQRAEL